MPTFRAAGRVSRFVLLVFSGFVAAGAIAADEPAVVVSPQNLETQIVTVEVSDLNLNYADARDRLVSRIDRAARRVCDVYAGSTLNRLPSAQACLADARSGAFAQIERRGFAPFKLGGVAGGMN